MDKSRAVVAAALAMCAISIALGVLQIGLTRKSQDFALPGPAWLSAGSSGVALIEIDGVIADGWGGPGNPGADRIVERIEQASTDPAVKGILLSVNSPGGAVGATKKIFDAVIKFRKNKPVVAYVTDIAASGGYYIASASEKIYAYKGSIIGSIGVIMIQPDASELLKKIGVTVTVIKAGRFKDSSYPFRQMTEEERLMHQKIVDDAYEQFLADVANGRKQLVSNVQKWGEGKVFSGAQAKSELMIDDFGGQAEALSALKEILKTKDDLPILKPKRDFLEDMLSGISAESRYHSNASIYYLYPDSVSLRTVLLRLAPQGLLP